MIIMYSVMSKVILIDKNNLKKNICVENYTLICISLKQPLELQYTLRKWPIGTSKRLSEESANNKTITWARIILHK